MNKHLFRFLSTRLVLQAIQYNTFLTQIKSSFNFLSFPLSFLVQTLKKNMEKIKKNEGNKRITHDEYHRFCDKALESNYFLSLLITACVCFILQKASFFMCEFGCTFFLCVFNSFFSSLISTFFIVWIFHFFVNFSVKI